MPSHRVHAENYPPSCISEILDDYWLKRAVTDWEATCAGGMTMPHENVIKSIYQALSIYQDVFRQTPWDVSRPIPLRLRQARKAYEAALIKGIRVGLRGHPLIANWITTHRGLGNRSLLRRGKDGLEKGVEALMSKDELSLDVEIAERHERGALLCDIYHALVAEKKYHKTRQAFAKWARRRGYEDPPKALRGVA